MKKDFFDIGTWVETKATVEFGYDGITVKRQMFTSNIGIQGRVVGMTYKAIGTWTGYSKFDWEAENYFTEEKRILVYLIKTGMINKPILCLPGDVKRIFVSTKKFPFVKRYIRKWTEEERQRLREDVKNQTRDSKGRWSLNG